jgi:hypothetical protein
MEMSGQLHAPAALTPGKQRRVPHWVGPRVGLNAVAKEKFPAPVGNRTPVIQTVA